MTLEEFKQQTFAEHPEVKEEYDKLEPEYSKIREEIRQAQDKAE